MTIRMTEEEFEEKYYLYSQELFNISYGYTHNVTDSEDILQNVFIKLLENKKAFKTKNDEKYWLIRVCINECINFVKSSHKKRVVFDDEFVKSRPSEANDDSKYDFINEYVLLLPEKYKKPIILYYYDNLKINEIANLLKLTEDAVRKRLERARNLLRNYMEGCHEK